MVAAAEVVPGAALSPPGGATEGSAVTGPADSNAAPGGPSLSSEELPPPQGLSPAGDNLLPPAGISPTGEPAATPNQFPPPSETQEMPPAQRIETEDIARGRAGALQQEECDTAVARLRAHRLDKIALNVQVTGEAGSDYPIECALGTEPAPSRAWPETIYTWKASGVCHKPLYFDEFALERHGHSKGPFVQPIYSAGHFYVNLALLPYKMGLRPPTECVYALGHYRAGSCAPYLVSTPPLSWRAGLAEAGAAVGVAAILP
jgi:hypothetical protein